MSKKIFIDAFYNSFGDFLNQLSGVFPDDTDIPAYKAGLTMLQKSNPTLAIREVHTYMSPYTEMIRGRNDDFFLQKDFNDEAPEGSSAVINKVKGLWQDLSANNKKVIWDYIVMILEISIRYHSHHA